MAGRASKFSLVGVTQHERSKVNLPGAVILRNVVESVKTVDDWIEYWGCEAPKRGRVIVFKCVNDDLRSDHGALYEIGKETKCSDWEAIAQCGNGLHFSPSPSASQRYSDGSRFLACSVSVKDMVLIDDKTKAPSCKVLHEVDIDGEKVG